MISNWIIFVLSISLMTVGGTSWLPYMGMAGLLYLVVGWDV
jgi:hypothetical protein